MNLKQLLGGQCKNFFYIFACFGRSLKESVYFVGLLKLNRSLPGDLSIFFLISLVTYQV
jgi:hypothetical protein